MCSRPYGQGLPGGLHPLADQATRDVHSTQQYLDTRITLVDQSNIDSYQDTMKQNFLEIKEIVENEIMQPNE